MSDSNLPPEQWRPLFDTIGVDFGYRALATHTGMTHTSIRRFMRGEGTTDETGRGIAEAFRVPVQKVYEVRGEVISIGEPFTLPDYAGRLNHDEREVVRSVIKTILKARESAAQPPAPQASNQDQKTLLREESERRAAEAGARMKAARKGVGGQDAVDS